MRLTGTLIILIVLLVSVSWAQDSSVVITGELYCYGNTISPPYSDFKVENGIGYINGVQVYPTLPEHPAPQITVSKQASVRHALNERAAQAMNTFVADKKSLADITKGVAAVYIADTALVAQVTNLGTSGFQLWWNGAKEPEFVEIPTTPVPDPADQARSVLETIRHNLGTGCIVIITSTVGYTVPSNDAARFAAIHEEIRRAHTTTPEDIAAGKWVGEHLPLGAVQQFCTPLPLQTQHKGQ